MGSREQCKLSEDSTGAAAETLAKKKLSTDRRQSLSMWLACSVFHSQPVWELLRSTITLLIDIRVRLLTLLRLM